MRERTGSEKLLLVLDRTEITDRGMAILAIVVTLDPEGQLPLQVLG